MKKLYGGMSLLQLRIILICVLINLLDGFDILAIAYTAPAIASQWALAPNQLGVLFSAGLAGMMLGALTFGPLADRAGRRPTILLCLGLAILSMLGATLSSDFIELCIARSVTGLAIGGMLPCINTLVAEYAAPRSRTLAVSVMQAGFPLGATIGGFCSVYLIGAFGWQSVFIAGAVVSAGLIPLVAFGMPESLSYLRAKGKDPRQLADILARVGELPDSSPVSHASEASGSPERLFDHIAPLCLISAAFFLAMMAFYFQANWTPKILVEAGLSESSGITGGAMMTAGGIFAALALGFGSFRFPLVRLVSLVMGAAAVLSVVFGQVASPLTLVLGIAFALGLTTNGAMIGNYAIVPGLFPSSLRAGGTGLALGIGRLGAVAGPFVAGLLIEAGWGKDSLFAAMAIPLLLCTLIVLKLQKYQRF